MVVFPNAKINLGLQVLNKRPDGYHEIETVFYPVPLFDSLEVIEAERFSFTQSGIIIEGSSQNNSTVQAYELLAKEYALPPIEIHLHKNIPIGAGLGGGSSDGAFMLKALNEKFDLKLPLEKLHQYARILGADCAFFLHNTPQLARGIGTEFTPIQLDLSRYHFCIVKPAIHISSAQAYRNVKLHAQGKKLEERIAFPVTEWKNFIFNDFETQIFVNFPEIQEIKQKLYEKGALFSSMSGSGSAVFGIFKEVPLIHFDQENYQVFTF